MLLRHIFTPKIAHSSYMLLGKASCAVVDPRRDVSVYVREATRLGVRITHVLETHLHADFVSGHMELAAATGAAVCAPASANCDFDHVPLREGDVVELKDMRLEVVETPGHTPEHICYVVTDTSRGDSPVSRHGRAGTAGKARPSPRLLRRGRAKDRLAMDARGGNCPGGVGCVATVRGVPPHLGAGGQGKQGDIGTVGVNPTPAIVVGIQPARRIGRCDVVNQGWETFVGGTLTA